jgi:hypothetical protein
MVSINTLRQLTLSFPETFEYPHFHKTAFKCGKKIFATLDGENHQANIKLSLVDQDVFCTFDRTVMFPVPNKWGQQGWTVIDLKKIRKSMLLDALTTAYCEVASAKLIEQLKNNKAAKKPGKIKS